MTEINDELKKDLFYLAGLSMMLFEFGSDIDETVSEENQDKITNLYELLEGDFVEDKDAMKAIENLFNETVDKILKQV